MLEKPNQTHPNNHQITYGVVNDVGVWDVDNMMKVISKFDECYDQATT